MSLANLKRFPESVRVLQEGLVVEPKNHELNIWLSAAMTGEVLSLVVKSQPTFTEDRVQRMTGALTSSLPQQSSHH